MHARTCAVFRAVEAATVNKVSKYGLALFYSRLAIIEVMGQW